jgi:glycosidase
MGGHSFSFMSNGVVCESVGLQIVMTSTRKSSSSFWANDGSDQKPVLADYAWQNTDGTTSYHIFCVQDDVPNRSKDPIVKVNDPYANDDGTNVTYGNAAYDNVNWTDKDIQATSPMFLKGTNGGATVTSNSNQGSLADGAGVGYQIMVSSFADSDGDGFGDIYGIDQKLDYLKDLGVNVLWLTPIQLSDSYHGYDITDYTQVDPKFGSSQSPAGKAASGKVTSDSAMKDYIQLLADAHSKNMLVLMDLVLNHTSTGNVWFTKSAQLDATYRGYYQWGNNDTRGSVINEQASWYPYGDHVYSYYAKFGSSMPELNYTYQSTRDAVAEMAKKWCSIGVDGFRMDAVKHIFLKDETTVGANDTVIEDGSYSSNLTKNLNFWRELAYDVKSVYPNALFVGENFDGTAYNVAPYYEGFDSLFDFYSHFGFTDSACYAQNASFGGGAKDVMVWDRYSGEDPFKGQGGSIKYGGNWNLKEVLDTYNKYRDATTASLSATQLADHLNANGYSSLPGAFTSNHDVPRCLNLVARSSSGEDQAVITSSNYDNALRYATLVEISELMLPGCTWIYYGDEIGMSGNYAGDTTSKPSSYADLAYRQPMKWVDDATAGANYTCGYSITGSGTKVSWDSVNASSSVIGADALYNKSVSSAHYQAIKDFAKVKSTIPALIRGNYEAYDWSVGNILNMRRILGDEKYHLIVNFNPSTSINNGGSLFTASQVVASYNFDTSDIANHPAMSAVLYKE